MARDFDATDDIITTTLTTNASLRTFAAWILIDGAGEGSAGRILDKDSGANTEHRWYVSTAVGDEIRYERTWSGGNGVWGMPRPSLSVWHHVAVTYDDGATTNDAVMYTDGALSTATERSTPTTAVLNNVSPFTFGNRTSDTNRTFDGRIAEFGMWDVILTADEIRALGSGISPMRIRRASLSGYWPLSGDTTEYDFSGNGNNGTVTGAVVIDHPPVQPPFGWD